MVKGGYPTGESMWSCIRCFGVIVLTSFAQGCYLQEKNTFVLLSNASRENIYLSMHDGECVTIQDGQTLCIKKLPQGIATIRWNDGTVTQYQLEYPPKFESPELRLQGTADVVSLQVQPARSIIVTDPHLPLPTRGAETQPSGFPIRPLRETTGPGELMRNNVK
jgi:hypothetical protein